MSKVSHKNLKKVKSHRKPSVEHNIFEDKEKLKPQQIKERYNQLQNSQENILQKKLALDVASDVEIMTQQTLRKESGRNEDPLSANEY